MLKLAQRAFALIPILCLLKSVGVGLGKLSHDAEAVCLSVVPSAGKASREQSTGASVL